MLKRFSRVGIILVILFSIYNIFIIINLSMCRDFGCLGYAIMSLFSGSGFIAELILRPLLEINNFSRTMGVVIGSIVMIPVYYLIGHFIGYIFSRKK